MHPRPRTALAALSLLLLITAPAFAAPRDTKVGDVRAVFARQGTPLRASPSALGAAEAMLPYGTQVRVVELRMPWMRVAAPGGKSGWLKTWETVTPNALGQNASPAHVTYSGQERVTGRELSAAQRQLDAGTESRYRTSRRDLAAAYKQVDAMEAATQALDPAEAIGFIVEGDLGRVGRDYARPGRVAAQPTRSRARTRNPGGLLGKLGGEVARRAGLGKTGSKIAEAVINSTTDYADQVAKKFTPQQEYFLGRAVAAQAIARYGLDTNPQRRHYVRLVGEALVRLSSRLPANFGGYHFDVLDTEEVNAVSGPGGFVLVTRGAVLAARNEAELAGVLAHELAHIRNGDAERLLRQSNKFSGMMKGLVNVAGAAAGAEGGRFAQGLVQFFGQAVDQMAATSIDHRYGKALESQADFEGTRILFDCFYDHDGLRSFLAHHAEHRHGGTATHADPAERAAALAPFVAAFKFPYNAGEETRALQAERFRKATGATGN